jgi:hypothetical protein
MNEAKVASFQVSLSAFQTWQQCEQRYFFSYVRRLRIRDQFLAPTLGRILHSYLEHYYTGLYTGHFPEDAHVAAQLQTSTEYIPEIRGYVNVSLAAGHEELAKELNELPALAARITDRYFAARGKSDAERYKILFIEKKLNLPIYEGIVSTGVVDLGTKDLETGRVNLWEHKSTQYIPQDSVRLQDFQTMLYGVKLRWMDGTIIDSIVWNYLRTKEPVEPEHLKSGALTKRKDLDSTWEMYSQVARDIGVDPETSEYAEVKERLESRELTIFFPRYEVVTVVSEEVLMTDYIEEAQRMRKARQDWANGVSKPIKTLTRGCGYCEYYRICQASLTGGDEEDVIRLRFTEGRSV